MATTPPPPSRVRTPPAPLHGTRYDNWEPFSPKRTTRASSMRMRHESPDAEPTASMTLSSTNQRPQYSLGSVATSITSTPRKSTLQRALSKSSQTLSPPSSPESQHRHATPAQPSTSTRRSLFTSRNLAPSASDTLSSNTASPHAMLPTPSKTPRKPVASASSMPTARILNFRPDSLDHIMPSPRKQRKSRLTLFDEDAPPPEKISVFTDTQDRVPDVDQSDDNPFLGPRKKTAKNKSSSRPESHTSSYVDVDDANDADMEEAVRNNEGLMYVFRGKKIFRPFSSTSPTSSAPEATPVNQSSLKRKAGAAAQRPLTRSSLQPKLLWPSDEQLDEKAAREAALHDDEEADTDIEQEHLPTPLPLAAQDLITPAKKLCTQPAHALTPPSSHRATRSASKKMSFLSTLEAVNESTESDTPASPAATPLPQKKAGMRKTSPFESWRRTKPSLSAPVPSSIKQGKKRALSPHSDEDIVNKRARAIPASPEHA